MRISCSSIFPALLLLAICSNVFSPSAEDEFVYYGRVPSNIQDRTEAQLYIVGNQDATTVTVLSLPGLEILAEFIVDRLEKKTVAIPGGMLFKLVSDKPATAILAGGEGVEDGSASIATFYTSVEGIYLGREFVFMAFSEKASDVHTVYALEDAEITIFDSSEVEARNLELPANGFEDFSLNAFQVYRLVSTGNVMLQSFSELAPIGWMTNWSSHIIPSPEGTFVGRYFYARGINPGFQAGGVEPALNFTFAAGQEAQLKIYDLKKEAKVADEEIMAGENRSLHFSEQHLFIESSNPTTLTLFANGGGLMAAGLKAGEAAYLRVPSEESFLFASYDETVISVDDAKVSLSADNVFQLPMGLHKIEADKTVVLVMVDYGSDPYLTSFGACLPSVHSLEQEYPELVIKPLEEGFPWMLVIGAVAGVILAAVALLVFRKVRSR